MRRRPEGAVTLCSENTFAAASYAQNTTPQIP